MLKQDEQERRRDIRVDFDTDVSVMADGVESRYRGNTRDLSLRGVFIKTTDTLKIGTHCQVEVMLSGLQDQLVLKMEGHVVRRCDEGFAIYFESVDLDSYTHLKNIVRYNVPDTDVIGKE